MTENIHVVVRIRPFLPCETSTRACLHVTPALQQIRVGTQRSFAFDAVLDMQCSEDDVYAAVARTPTRAFLDGVNACAMAYGQTGAGKTHTMQHIGNTVVQDVFAALSTDTLQRRLYNNNNNNNSIASRGCTPRAPTTSTTPRVSVAMSDDVCHTARSVSRAGSVDMVASSSSPLTTALYMSALEVYKDEVKDLLQPTSSSSQQQQQQAQPQQHSHANAAAASMADLSADNVRTTATNAATTTAVAAGTPLKLREDPKLGVCVVGLTEVAVCSAAELHTLLQRAMANRTTAATLMNATSSRSHCVVTLTLTRRGTTSRLCLVDLAGSERFKKSLGVGSAGSPSTSGGGSSSSCCYDNNSSSSAVWSSVDGEQQQQAALLDRMREGICVNTGLLALGNVIVALCERKPHVPYRASKLTRLLQPMLSGNSRTTMVACVSPHYASLDETLNTLKYANRAKSIKTTPQLAITHFTSYAEAERTIVALRQELNDLQQQLTTSTTTATTMTAAMPAAVSTSSTTTAAAVTPIVLPATASSPRTTLTTTTKTPRTQRDAAAAGGVSNNNSNNSTTDTTRAVCTLQQQVTRLELLLAQERQTTRRLEDELFCAEYTTMVEVERRKAVEQQCVVLERCLAHMRGAAAAVSGSKGGSSGKKAAAAAATTTTAHKRRRGTRTTSSTATTTTTTRAHNSDEADDDDNTTHAAVAAAATVTLRSTTPSPHSNHNNSTSSSSSSYHDTRAVVSSPRALAPTTPRVAAATASTSSSTSPSPRANAATTPTATTRVAAPPSSSRRVLFDDDDVDNNKDARDDDDVRPQQDSSNNNKDALLRELERAMAQAHELQQQHEVQRAQLDDAVAALASAQQARTALEQERTRSLATLEAAPRVTRAEKQLHRHKLQLHYREATRRADDALSRSRARVSELEASLRTLQQRVASAQATQHALQQRHAEAQERQRQRAEAAAQRRRSARREVHDAWQQWTTQLTQLRRRCATSSERARTSSSSSPPPQQEQQQTSSSQGNTTTRNVTDDGQHDKRSSCSSSGKVVRTMLDVQTEIDAEVRYLADVEKELDELQAYRVLLCRVCDDDVRQWRRTRDTLSRRARQIDSDLADADTAAATLSPTQRAAAVLERDEVQAKLQQLRRFEDVFTTGTQQLQELDTRIDSLQDVRRYRMQRVRRLQNAAAYNSNNNSNSSSSDVTSVTGKLYSGDDSHDGSAATRTTTPADAQGSGSNSDSSSDDGRVAHTRARVAPRSDNNSSSSNSSSHHHVHFVDDDDDVDESRDASRTAATAADATRNDRLLRKLPSVRALVTSRARVPHVDSHVSTSNNSSSSTTTTTTTAVTAAHTTCVDDMLVCSTDHTAGAQAQQQQQPRQQQQQQRVCELEATVDVLTRALQRAEQEVRVLRAATTRNDKDTQPSRHASASRRATRVNVKAVPPQLRSVCDSADNSGSSHNDVNMAAAASANTSA